MGIYTTYREFLQKKFGNDRILKISIDSGFSCPNRDGRVGVGGCTFCQPRAFTPPGADVSISIAQQITEQVKFYNERFKAKKFVYYFQPGSNTYGSVAELKKVFDEALSVYPDKVLGLALGTRADCLDSDILELLEEYAKKYWLTVEIGVESIYDKTLIKINRGHNYDEVKKALENLEPLIRDHNIDVCGHYIIGFPWETQEEQLNYADEINRSLFTQVKFHQLHILKNTQLEREYYRNPFPLLTLEQYCYIMRKILEKLDKKIVVQRVYATAPKDLLVAPHWGTIGAVRNYIEHYLS